MASIADMAKATAPREVQLPKAYTLEEIFAKIDARKDAFQMPFEMKNGITGEHISFKKEPALDVVVNVSVKEDVMKVSAVIKETSASVGGMNVGKNSVLRKGVDGVLDLPMQRGAYIDTVADTIKKILNDEPVEAYVAPEVPESEASSGKSWTTTLILLILLGSVGGHRFYVGKIGTGILYLCTLGLCGIGWIVDLVKLLTNKFTDKDGNVISK